MALTFNKPVGGATLSTTTTHTSTTSTSHRRLLPSTLPLSSTRKCTTHIVAATGKFTSRTGKFDSRNKRGGPSTTTTKEESSKRQEFNGNVQDDGSYVVEDFVDDGFVMPDLPGLETDFWEGPQFDALGFFVQYMWAFGIIFAVAACGVAVTTYNEGATDFKNTPAYKESIQSRDLLEGPEASDSDVFESNPTEEAPALE